MDARVGGTGGISMTRKEKDELMAIYETLVMAEHDSGKYIVPKNAPEGGASADWLDGYCAGTGHALDLLGNFMGLGVKID